MRLEAGQIIAPLALSTLQDQPAHLPAMDGRRTHLQFRRFAGCPICNLHLRSFAARVGELEAAGIQEIAVFHSDAETMRPFQGDLPFAVIADPDKVLYRQFGVEAALRSLVDPRAWPGLMRGLLSGASHNPMSGEGGHLGLPADFLIGSDGTLLACKAGTHADDQWTLDEVLALARAPAST